MTLKTSYQSDDDVFYVGDNLTLTCSTSAGSGVNYQLGIVFDVISNSSDDEISTRFFVPTKQIKSVTPRPNDIVCHTTDAQSG